jgi:hypothetical protein
MLLLELWVEKAKGLGTERRVCCPSKLEIGVWRLMWEGSISYLSIV